MSTGLLPSSPDETALHAARVATFKSDVTHLDIVTTIQKHITTGVPAAILPDVYFNLRLRIAQNFGLHPNHIIVVGSARLGFSLKPHKRFAFAEPKDIDVAVISDRLFDEYWEMIFEKVRFDRTWPSSSKKNQRFVRSLFAGWITPHELPNLPTFARAKSWVEFFDVLTRERLCGIRKISGRLYRTWSRLEAYQELMVKQCKRDLENN